MLLLLGSGGGGASAARLLLLMREAFIPHVGLSPHAYFPATSAKHPQKYVPGPMPMILMITYKARGLDSHVR